jgi:hypothetical protein
VYHGKFVWDDLMIEKHKLFFQVMENQVGWITIMTTPISSFWTCYQPRYPVGVRDKLLIIDVFPFVFVVNKREWFGNKMTPLSR